MSLRAQAAADLPALLQADGEDVTLINPAGAQATVKAVTKDIGGLIDPETGQVFAGRMAGVGVRLADFPQLGRPQAVQDSDENPWLVRVADLSGVVHAFKVSKVMEDKTLGFTWLDLEVWG